jgi:chemotaxis-related protein WspD
MGGKCMDAHSRKSQELVESAPAAPAAGSGSSPENVFDCWNRIGVNGDGTCAELATVIHCRNCSVYSAAGRKLLDREAPPGYRRYWTKHFSHPQKPSLSNRASAVIFRIGIEWLALATRVFREVAEQRTIHSLPHRRNGIVLGVTNVHGQLVPCISLGRLMGIGLETGVKKSSPGCERLIVAEWQQRALTFPVNEVHGVEWHDPGQIQAAPASVVGAGSNFTRGLLPWRDSMVGWLDEELLFTALDRSLA